MSWEIRRGKGGVSSITFVSLRTVGRKRYLLKAIRRSRERDGGQRKNGRNSDNVVLRGNDPGPGKHMRGGGTKRRLKYCQASLPAGGKS